MASKALFAALHVDLFTHLSQGGRTIEEISTVTKVPRNRITTLVTALTSIGALKFEDMRYTNSPAADHFLVRGAKYDFGDYLRYQIDKQMYPFMEQLNDVLDGTVNPDTIDSYAHWMSDSEQASLYSESQHSGSLGPGRTLARAVDLSNAKSMLDVGGGTGAMTISLCQAYPELQSTIIDFPNVAEIGWRFITEADLVNRVRYVPGNALDSTWPTKQDAVLMSYLLSGVPGDRIPDLLQRSWDSLEPGGVLMVHDFMIEKNRRGPTLAALWQLQHMAFTPDARSIATDWLAGALGETGFKVEKADDHIPGMTKLIVGRKPA
ncbi:MAG: methyltransferase [Alphaproteobacteria bacterium]|nr:methyltransferase [Alphaproteobacteria bacterium]